MTLKARASNTSFRKYQITSGCLTFLEFNLSSTGFIFCHSLIKCTLYLLGKADFSALKLRVKYIFILLSEKVKRLTFFERECLSIECLEGLCHKQKAKQSCSVCLLCINSHSQSIFLCNKLYEIIHQRWKWPQLDKRNGTFN